MTETPAGGGGPSESGTARPASLRLVPQAPGKLSAREFKTDQEGRWCPG